MSEAIEFAPKYESASESASGRKLQQVGAASGRPKSSEKLPQSRTWPIQMSLGGPPEPGTYLARTLKIQEQCFPSQINGVL